MDGNYNQQKKIFHFSIRQIIGNRIAQCLHNCVIQFLHAKLNFCRNEKKKFEHKECAVGCSLAVSESLI